MDDWLRARLRDDCIEIAHAFGKPLGLSFRTVRVRAQKNIWATCGKDGTLFINHQLIKVPRKVLEYVVAHELAHLRCRNHSERFRELVGRMVPGYKGYQDALDGIS
jgi:predicted metal-dependent hydrolase